MSELSHAASYSSTPNCLRVADADAIHSTEPLAVMKQLRSVIINDAAISNGHLREDGSFIHDDHLARIKLKAQMANAWDYYEYVKRIDVVCYIFLARFRLALWCQRPQRRSDHANLIHTPRSPGVSLGDQNHAPVHDLPRTGCSNHAPAHDLPRTGCPNHAPAHDLPRTGCSNHAPVHDWDSLGLNGLAQGNHAPAHNALLKNISRQSMPTLRLWSADTDPSFEEYELERFSPSPQVGTRMACARA